MVAVVCAGCIEQPAIGEIPTVQYTAPVNAYSGQALVFDATASSDPEGRLAWYQFDFGDGAAAVRTKDPVIDHVYDEVGVYTTRVGVIDDVGNKFTELRDIHILDRDTVTVLLCTPSRPYCPPFFFCETEDHHCVPDVDGDGIPKSEDPDEPGCATDATCPAETACLDGLCR
jgi:hypothetical protein